MPRSRLGPLAIESKLGDHPSQSHVWHAIHVKLKRALAVKVFSTPFGGTPEARKRFSKEWSTLKRLDHPAIAKCYGGGFEQTDAYLAYELVDGDTLAAELETRGRLSWEIVLDFAESIVDALRYLHERELIYGALAPDKIVFAGLSPVLVDVRADRDGPFSTNRPPTLDELALRPPEVGQDSSAAVPQSDLYSLGATMYLALTGRPPFTADTSEALAAQIAKEQPQSPASLVLDCPVWLDKLVMQMLEKDPAKRPHGAAAVSLALAEVRRRAMSRAGVAEHASAGFSPLNVTDQEDRDEARELLGRRGVDDADMVPDGTPWHDKPWVLISGLALVLGLIAYWMWPLSEEQMRGRAEELLAQGTRTSLNEAKLAYLEPMLERFPDGQHVTWAEEQIERVEMLQAERALDVKVKRNLPLKNEAERLYVEASNYERFGDIATALDKYQSMETLLADDSQYRAYVNLARRQIAKIEEDAVASNEAAEIIEAKLEQAEELFESGKVVAARKIWYSVVELYGNNENVAPYVARAQDRLAGLQANEKESTP